jgi:hypothetical protein
MPSEHVHPGDDLCHLLVEVTNDAPTEQYAPHHPAWRSDIGRKRGSRRGVAQVSDPDARCKGHEVESKEAGGTGRTR